MVDYRDRDRDRDNKPSWSEIDKNKNKSSHVRDERPAFRKKKEVTTGYGQYKEQLDELFKTGQQSGMVKSVLGRKDGDKLLKKSKAPERQKLLRAVREAIGERDVEKTIDSFLAKFKALPDDIEIQTQALLHSDDRIKEKALRSISKHLDGHKLERKSLLLERAKSLIDLSEDDDVIELAQAVKKKLGG
ncbi:MAG: hypothetical protein ABIJ56_21260 [Pseudomonadota bacterium]